MKNQTLEQRVADCLKNGMETSVAIADHLGFSRQHVSKLIRALADRGHAVLRGSFILPGGRKPCGHYRWEEFPQRAESAAPKHCELMAAFYSIAPSDVAVPK